MDPKQPPDPTAIPILFHNLCDAVELANASITLPITFVVFHWFILNLLAFFSHVWMIFKEPTYLLFVLITDGAWIISNYAIQTMIIYASSSATKAAEQTSIIICKILAHQECSKSHAEVFKAFLIHNLYRNLKFQTPFFTINWKLLLAVSSMNKMKHFD